MESGSPGITLKWDLLLSWTHLSPQDFYPDPIPALKLCQRTAHFRLALSVPGSIMPASEIPKDNSSQISRMVWGWKWESPASGGTLASRAHPAAYGLWWVVLRGDDGRTLLSEDRPSSSCRDSQGRAGPANTPSNLLPEASFQGPCFPGRKG